LNTKKGEKRVWGGSREGEKSGKEKKGKEKKEPRRCSLSLWNVIM